LWTARKRRRLAPDEVMSNEHSSAGLVPTLSLEPLDTVEVRQTPFLLEEWLS
jgi:hypothetical protein